MLSERIKELRNKYNLSQVQLAVKLSVTKQSVSNWENDNIVPSVELLVRIAQLFGVSTDYLLGLDDRKYLEVTNLTKDQIVHLQLVANDLGYGNVVKTTNK